MATRAEKIAFIQARLADGSQTMSADQVPSPVKTREEKIAFIEQKLSEENEQKESGGETIGGKILGGVAAAGKVLDSYTGAPIRAGIGAAQDGKNPIAAAAGQFGEDPSLAPTGKDIAKKAGVSDTSLSEVAPGLFSESGEGWRLKKGGAGDITASGAAGLGIDIAADPTSLIPGAALAKGTKLAAKGVREGAKVASSLANPILDKAGDVLKAVTVKGGSTLTGLPEKNIATYIEKTDEVEKLIGKHGGDMSLAADELRENLSKAIQTKIGSLNDDVKKAIAEAPAGSFASNEGIVKALEHVKSGINPNLYPGSVAEIDDLLVKVKGLSKPPEYMSLLSPNAQKEAMQAINADAANQAKRFLQDQARGSYLKGGQIFQASPQATRAANLGARQARKVEMKLAPGTIKPNKELSKLHAFEKNVNKNLIAPGKTESALMAAGSNSNARNVKNLKEIGEATGFDALGEAEKLSAARAFADPSLLPVDATGKSATRMAAGALLGSMFGGPLTTAAGIAATSPKVLKMAIKSGKASGDLVKKLAGGATDLSDKTLDLAIKAADTEKGRAIIRASEKLAKQANIQGLNKVAEEKPRGEEKWAQDGFNKVLQSTSDPEKLEKYKSMREALLKSPRSRRLLVNASDLKPGTKAFENILKELEKEGGK